MITHMKAVAAAEPDIVLYDIVLPLVLAAAFGGDYIQVYSAEKGRDHRQVRAHAQFQYYKGIRHAQYQRNHDTTDHRLRSEFFLDHRDFFLIIQIIIRVVKRFFCLPHRHKGLLAAENSKKHNVCKLKNP